MGKNGKVKPKEKKEKPQQMTVVESLVEPMALGDVFVKSGMFKDLQSQAQAVVKILAGRELGLAPLESMTNIYIVNGKVALQAKLIGSLIKKSAKYDYTVDKLENEECTITFHAATAEGGWKEIGKSSFTKADAARAGIINKDVWKNYPRNMMFARALSNGSKWYCSDVFCGYTAEELETTREVTSVITIGKNGEVKENGEKKI